MKRLLLILAVLAMAPAASAQWSYAGNFPADGSVLTPHNHGLAVAPDGKVWIQSYYPQTGDSVSVAPAIVAASSAANCKPATNKCRVSAVYVLNPDGTQASFSPLSIVTLPGGEADTLGGGSILNSSGVRVWDWSSGRGVRALPDGNILVAYFNTLYKFNSTTGAVMDFMTPTILDARGIAAPAADAAGNIFVTGVFPGDPYAYYNSSLDYAGNVTATSGGFNRTTMVLPEPNNGAALVAILPNYSGDIATVYQRSDEFADFDSTGVTFEGMSVESFVMHPTTGQIWASAGSPNDPPAGRYQSQTWYAFDRADVISQRKPTPRDSIKWDTPADGRPRAIAFSPDGMTAYVGAFNLANPSVQKFVRSTAAQQLPGEAAGMSLSQNQPNPFSGSTNIEFSLENASYVTLKVYDTTGREVAVLVDDALTAGNYSAPFESGSLAAGVYVYNLQADGQQVQRRMLIVR